MKKTISLFISLLAFIGLACGLSLPKDTNSGERDQWPTPVVSEEQAQILEQNVKSAIEQLNANQPVVLIVTESELTSFVKMELARQGVTVISEPQIYLRSGLVQVFAQYKEGNAALDFSATMEFLVVNGQISVKLQKITLGGFNAPELLRSQAQTAITDQVEPALNQWLANGMYIDSLAIADGTLTLTGHKP